MSALKRRLRTAGWMIRLTEWHEGFQGVAVLRRDLRVRVVTPWVPTETEMWATLASMAADELAKRPTPAPVEVDVSVTPRSAP